MIMDRPRSTVSLIVNLLIAVFTIFSVGSFFFYFEGGALQQRSFRAFRYFTTDSNVLAAAVALCMIPFAIKGLTSGSVTVPRALLVFKYVGCTAVTVTLLTVVLFLGQIYGYPSMFAGANLFLHLVCPLLCLFAFLFLEGPEGGLTVGEALLGLLPVLLYGILYYVKVVAIGKDAGGWPDFYGFNVGGRWYISYVIMLAATTALCFLLRFLQKKISA